MIDLDCAFCEIVEGDDPDAREVYRDERVMAFFPTEPAALGHTLVIPLRHIPDIWSLDVKTGDDLSRVTIRLAGAIREAVRPDGLNVIQSNGEAATQTVRHLHIHLLPRWEDDSIGPIWPRRTNYSERQKDDALTKVREVLRASMSN